MKVVVFDLNEVGLFLKLKYLKFNEFVCFERSSVVVKIVY